MGQAHPSATIACACAKALVMHRSRTPKNNFIFTTNQCQIYRYY